MLLKSIASSALCYQQSFIYLRFFDALNETAQKEILTRMPDFKKRVSLLNKAGILNVITGILVTAVCAKSAFGNT